MHGMSMMQCQAPLILQAPPQPEVYLSCVANAISVRWSTVGIPAVGFVVELREASTPVSSRFTCQAPNDGTSSVELCIQGLQPGNSYTACVCSVTQEGFESAPSSWSYWVTLPSVPTVMFQPCHSVPCSNNSMIHMSSPMVATEKPSPYSILFDEVEKLVEECEKVKASLVKAGPPPEITVCEDALFLD